MKNSRQVQGDCIASCRLVSHLIVRSSGVQGEYDSSLRGSHTSKVTQRGETRSTKAKWGWPHTLRRLEWYWRRVQREWNCQVRMISRLKGPSTGAQQLAADSLTPQRALKGSTSEYNSQPRMVSCLEGRSLRVHGVQ